jgi:hypothetical protein
LILVLIYSCANKGIGPTGGLKDTLAPQVIYSIPKNGVVNYKKKQIRIDFDENINIVKLSENVFISPPQLKVPDVKAIGKRIEVELNDDLKDSTTYTISFGNGIVDVNESNPLKNYQFSFSTSNEIDSLQIAGNVLNSENLNPISGLLVGVYPECSDSIFKSIPFQRIARTDENGYFCITNLKKGSYKVFALNDQNRDYFYQLGEGLAMHDSIIKPTCTMVEFRDSIWSRKKLTDTVKVLDSVRVYSKNEFKPNKLTLKFFKESKKKQYLVKYERKQAHVLKLAFNSKSSELPHLRPLNFDWSDKYLLQSNNSLDSLSYWLTDSTIIKMDTLKIEIKYQKSDSLLRLVSKIDTLNFIYRKLKVVAKSKEKSRSKMPVLDFKTNAVSPFELNNQLKLTFTSPVQNCNETAIKLFQKVDTLFVPKSFKWIRLDSIGLVYAIDHNWLSEELYKLQIDSAAIKNIYGVANNSFQSEFKVRSLEEYSKLKIFLTPFNPKAVLQVLNEKDEVIMSSKAIEKGNLFDFLKPGSYYIRLYVDENQNGIWDTGEFDTRRQPETVIYYNKKLSLLANWEFEETWDTTEKTNHQLKPKELIKSAVQNLK